MKRLAMVLSCSNPWLPFAAVTCWSAIQSGAPDSDYFILSDRRGDIDLDRFAAKIGALFGKEITVREVDQSALSMIMMGHHPPSKFYRLAIDCHLSDKYDRVLYLDSDMLVLRKLDPLLNAELNDKPVGAVINLEYVPANILLGQRKRIEIGLDGSRNYFNSGVLLFDWKKTLDSGLIGEVKRHLSGKTYRECADQDALNVVWADRWHPLPLNYNVNDFAVEFVRSPAIRHFTGRSKPWRNNFRKSHAEHRDIYRSSLRALGYENLFEPGPSSVVRMLGEKLERAIEPIHYARRELTALFSETYAEKLRLHKGIEAKAAARDFLAAHIYIDEEGLL